MAKVTLSAASYIENIQKTISAFENKDFLPFYIFHGKEPFFPMFLANQLEEYAIPSEFRTLNSYKVVIAPNSGLEPRIYAAGLFAPRGETPRTLVSVREADNIKMWETLLPLFKNPNPTAIIALQFGAEVDLKKGTALKEIVSIVEKAGGVFQSQLFYENNVNAIISFIAKCYDVTIEPTALGQMKMLYGTDLMLIDNEIRKMESTMPSHQRMITQAILTGNKVLRTYNIFDLTGLLSRKDIKPILPILEKLTTGADALSLESIIYNLYRYFRNAFLYSILAKKKMDTAEIQKVLELNTPQLRVCTLASGAYSPAYCAKVFELLRDFDQKIKTGEIARDSNSVLNFEAMKQLLLNIFSYA